MLELLDNNLQTIAFYFPLGIIGLWRWSVWGFKKIIAWHYKHIENSGYDTTLSVITPVYNEDPKLFRSALKSWKQNNPEEIIAVIDRSDKACIQEFRDFSEIYSGAKLIVTSTPGKRSALRDGIKASSSEIVALVDSDTLWDKNIRKGMMAPFADDRVGGVGTRQVVLKAGTIAERLFDIHLDHRYFDEMSFLAKSGNALTCLSGRTAVYRKKAVMEVVDDMVNETFWRKQCISGEDKCLTRLVQAEGWVTRYQKNICVRTPGMPDIMTFLKQQVRWIRNSWRSDLKSLFSKWLWKREKMLALHMMDRFVQPFTLILGPIYFVLAILSGHWIVAAVLLVWWHVSRAIKLYPHLKNNPKDLLILPAYVAMTYIIGVIKIYDLFTINKQGWITRWDKKRLGEFKYLKILPAYFGTLSVILLLAFGVANYKYVLTVAKSDTGYISDSSRYMSKISFKDINFTKAMIIDEYEQDSLNNSGEPKFETYIVKKGDVLWRISLLHKVSLAEVIEANRSAIPNPDLIQIDQKVVIPILETENDILPDKSG